MIFLFTEIFQRKDHDQDNLIKIEMVDVSPLHRNFNLFSSVTQFAFPFIHSSGLNRCSNVNGL